MPDYVRVLEMLAPGHYMVEDELGAYLYHGNAEQVHSWLGREGYAQTGKTGPTPVEGWYKRAIVSAVS